MGIACLPGGDDKHAIVSFVFQVKEPQKGGGQFRAIRRGAAEEVRGAAMVIAAMPGLEPCAADAVGGGDAGQDGKPG